MLKRAVSVMLLSPLVVLALVPLAVSSRASAQGGATAAPQPAMKGEVKPGQWQDYNPKGGDGAKGASRKTSSGSLVVTAYVIIWAVVLVYVLVLALRQRRLASEVTQLRRRLDDLEPPPDASGSGKP